jgi:hypothetical protein
MMYSFYDETTGDFSGRVFSGSARLVALNTPTGYVAISGRFDRLSQRVDTKTGEVVDYQPPKPDDDHEWNTERRRWVKKPDVLVAERRGAAARKRIAELEASQLRALREHALGDATAVDRLRAIDDEIKTLRADLLRAPNA